MNDIKNDHSNIPSNNEDCKKNDITQNDHSLIAAKNEESEEDNDFDNESLSHNHSDSTTDLAPQNHQSYMKKQQQDKKTLQKTDQKLVDKNEPKQCDICGGFKKDLIRHKLIHLAMKEELYLQCDICGKKFLGKKYLQRHIKRHFGYKKFVFDLSIHFAIIKTILFFFQKF